MSPVDCRIAVVGGGIVGLTTAVLVQQTAPKHHVTLIADKFLEETTSDGAAGLFRPAPNFGGPNPETTKKWISDSFKFYNQFLQTSVEKSKIIGIVARETVMLSTKSKESLQNPILEWLFPDFRFLSPSDTQQYSEGQIFPFGAAFTALLVECRLFMPHLMRRFASEGGTIVKRKINGWSELSSDFDLVFNCSGLGSKVLCGDFKITPIRGQVYKVFAPWVTRALYVDSDTYIIPGASEGLVTLGGTRQFDSTNEECDDNDAKGIWHRCTSAMPSLKQAKVVRQWVGLRPYRPEIRVEQETIKLESGKTIKLIHNYGHGGYGVLSAPGTSIAAVKLSLDFLGESEVKSNIEAKFGKSKEKFNFMQANL